jgi:hypothetical protein
VTSSEEPASVWMVKRWKYGCREPWSNASNIPTFGEHQSLRAISRAKFESGASKKILWRHSGSNYLISFCILGRFIACSRTPMTDHCPKSKTLSLELHILSYEYRRWQVRILAGAPTFVTEDSLNIPPCFQAYVGTMLILGSKHFLSLPLQFIASMRYQSLIRCCLVTIIGSIVKYVWARKGKQSDYRRSNWMWFSYPPLEPANNRKLY